MVDRRLRIAVVLVLLVGAGVLAGRLGVLGAGSRVWRTCLFWAAVGAVLVLSMDLIQFGFADVLSVATLVGVAVGALGGTLAGLLMSYFERRWPS